MNAMKLSRLFAALGLLVTLGVATTSAQTPILIGSFPVSASNENYGIAIDPSGTVSSFDYGNNAVDRYSPTGTFLSSYSLSSGPYLANIAPNGNLYVGMYGNTQIAVLNPTTGATLFRFSSMSEPAGITFGNGDVYVSSQN
jgi:streptogramin lyase